MIYSKRQDSGAVFIELLLVLPILLVILAGAFEVSRLINYKNAAIQLSTQAANEVYRECTSDKGILMSDCVSRVQRDMTQFAIDSYPNFDRSDLGASHVAITVYFNRANMNSATPEHQYTARADASEFPNEPDYNQKFNFNADKAIAIDDWDTLKGELGDDVETILQNTGYVVVAQSYIRYQPLARIFGTRIFSGDFITDYTVI